LRIEHYVRQHESVLCGMAREIDAGRTPHHAPRAVGSDDIARRKAEGCFAALAFEDDAVCSRLCRFDQVAAPDVHAKLQRPRFEERLGRGLRQKQRKREARVEHREV
jgi:hypothetical protein